MKSSAPKNRGSETWPQASITLRSPLLGFVVASALAGTIVPIAAATEVATNSRLLKSLTTSTPCVLALANSLRAARFWHLEGRRSHFQWSSHFCVAASIRTIQPHLNFNNACGLDRQFRVNGINASGRQKAT